jgi:hypothetical protein
VVADDYSLTLPASLSAGRSEFVFENRGHEPHYFRLMQFADGKGLADFVQWRKSRTPVPAWLIPAGGAGTLAPGERVTYSSALNAGSYVAFCGHPSPDGVPHVDKGMYAALTVTAESAGGPPPRATVEIELSDQGISVTPPFRGGSQSARIRNTGARTHQALLIRLPDGVQAADELEWFRNGSRGVRPGHPVGGVIELQAGGEAWIGVDIRPGRYLLLCAVPAPDGKRHFDHGMLHAFTIS